MSILWLPYFHPFQSCKTDPEILKYHIKFWSSMAIVGTPPPDDTWRASLSGTTPSGLPKEGHVARSPIRTSSGRSTRHSRTSYPDDSISYPDMLSGSLTKVSKSCYVIPTAYHSPHSATCRAKGQEWWQVTSHDLWQPRRLPRSLTAARRVMMALPPPTGIITSQKVFPPLKRETELLTLYIWIFTQGGR